MKNTTLVLYELTIDIPLCFYLSLSEIMQHLTVIFGMLALCVGIISYMVVHGFFTRFRTFFLKTYLKYLMVLNISVLLNLTVSYFLANVDLPLDTKTRVIVIIVVNIIGFYLFVLLLQYYLLLTRSLIGRGVSGTMNRFLVFLMIIAAVAYGFATAVYANSANIKLFLLIHKIFVTVPILISGIATIVLFLNADAMKLQSQVKTVRIFSLVYLAFFCYQLGLWILPVRVWIMLSAFNLLIFNIIPIPFLANLLKKQKTAVLDQTDTRSNIESFFRLHRLSKREKEIVELVVSGLSNKEIENELYISKFTVKKHISNIFIKVDVNSRPQLINKILQAALSDSSDSPLLFK